MNKSSKLGTTNDYSVRFYTNNVQRMIINSPSGLVGIGTPTPTARLQVNSASGANALRVQVNGSTKLLVHSKGGVAIGANTTPPANGLYVSGNVGIGTGAASSVRLRVDGDGNYGEDGYGGSAIYGSGGDYGVIGSGVGAGVSGSGDYSGVQGTASFGTGVDGWSTDGDGGSFYSENGNGIHAGTRNGNYAGYFDGDVYCSGTAYQSSDKNLKKNIQKVENAMSIIQQLKPTKYEFRNDVKFASLNLPKGNHYGLIAQELEEVLPNLVKESKHELRDTKLLSAVRSTADGKQPFSPIEKKETKESINIKAVNYTELIPIIVKAMQEQEAIIEKQNAKIEDLTQFVNKLSKNSPSVKLTGAFLGQSSPNPNSTNTRIIYNIPSGFSRAELVINNEAGQKVKQMQLNKSGLVDINTSRLSAGTYFYTLYVNGTSVDTKKMVVIR